ncbi:MAG: DUF6194 family protein [Candidatus Dormiibacterota bacterium]
MPISSGSPLAAAGSSFEIGGGRALLTALSAFLETFSPRPELLALGEPTHGEPAFPSLRNRIFEALVEHGFRSIAIESDGVSALDVDAFVHDQRGTFDVAVAQGFSHGFGQLEANRELVAWMRTYNDQLPTSERLAFYGFDAPLEMIDAPSPRSYLEHALDYLAEQLGPGSLLHSHDELERLLGDDERWSDPAVRTDPEKSVGASTEAARLRVIADDLTTALHAQAPRLVAASSSAEWHRAELLARTACGLLRYHAQAAATAPQALRTSRLLGVRDALMAENLLAIRAREQHRGATLVFAHNRHLQRHLSTLRMADMDLEWFSAGAILASLVGERYVFIAGSLGASATLELSAPSAGTFEGALQQAMRGCALFHATPLNAALGADAGKLHVRTDVTAELGYFPLDAATLGHSNGVLHVASSSKAPAPDADDLAARIVAMREVSCVRADEASGAPEVAWGDRFFYAGPDRRLPFATIVESDYPGWDEASRLDRPGVFRLNIDLGRAMFEQAFGFSPAAFGERQASIDFTKFDEFLPHPAYAAQGWACILNPSARRLLAVDVLLDGARRRVLARQRRSSK